jgi:hypothetical protein
LLVDFISCSSGVHLKDIISLHVAFQDRLEYDLINFRKLAQLSIVFRTLTNLQLSVPPIQPNHDLIHLLTVHLRQEQLLKMMLTIDFVSFVRLAIIGFNLHRR